jgi:ADP-ribose pyrophosphatase YjhB (NUDIX family)
MMTILSKLWRILPYAVRLRFIRSTQSKFTVSVVAVILNKKNEVLVLDHFIRPGASWGLPGGFIEKDEYPDEAIRREIKEETDLEITNVRLLLVRTIRKHIELLYVANADGDVVLKSSEIRDFGWFREDKLPEGVSKVQRALIKEVLNDS